MVTAKLTLVVGGGSEVMTGREWSWVVVTKLWLVVGGRSWLRMVMDGRTIW